MTSYIGISKRAVFYSTAFQFDQPISATEDLGIAKGFAEDKNTYKRGMILEICDMWTTDLLTETRYQWVHGWISKYDEKESIYWGSHNDILFKSI